MDRKKIVYQIITAAWDKIKKYDFGLLTMEQWEELIHSKVDTSVIPYDSPEYHLAREIIMAIVGYYERIDRNERVKNR